MKDFVGLFVILDENKDEKYLTLEMSGDFYPKNNANDIIDIVRVAQQENPEHNIMDMYGYVRTDENNEPLTVWFEEEQKQKR